MLLFFPMFLSAAIEKLLLLSDRSRMPMVVDAIAEQRKMGLIRITLGVIIILRHSQILHSAYVVNDVGLIATAWLAIGIALLFTVGLFTPLATLGLVVAGTALDFKAEALTLGTTILHPVLISMVLLNHGKYYSIDRLLLDRRFGIISNALQRLYSMVGDPGPRETRLVYLLLFSVYALLSLVAVSYHLVDKLWMSGYTVQVLLTSSFWSRHFDLFRWLEDLAPQAFRLFSILIGLLQTAFQLFMIPLVFFRWGRDFVQWWGWIFIIISLFFLQLSYLPHVEMALWLLVFHPVTAREHIKLLYDDRCNLCKRTVAVFNALNFNRSMRFLPASRHLEMAEQYNVTPLDLNLFMHGIYRDRLVSGFDLYLLAFRLNPLYWPVLPLMYIAKWTAIGPGLYNAIAVRRYRLFGTCKVSYEPVHGKHPMPPVPYRGWFGVFAYFLILAPIVCFLWFPLPRRHLDSVSLALGLGRVDDMGKARYALGFIPPLVFNTVDLSCSDKWLVIHREDVKGNMLVPMNREDGSRGTYQGINYMLFKNHNTDYLYFGSMLLNRRDLTINSVTTLSREHSVLRKSLMRTLAYDYRYSRQQGDVKYFISLHQNNCSRVDSLRGPDRYLTTVIPLDTILLNDSIATLATSRRILR